VFHQLKGNSTRRVNHNLGSATDFAITIAIAAESAGSAAEAVFAAEISIKMIEKQFTGRMLAFEVAHYFVDM